MKPALTLLFWRHENRVVNNMNPSVCASECMSWMSLISGAHFISHVWGRCWGSGSPEGTPSHLPTYQCPLEEAPRNTGSVRRRLINLATLVMDVRAARLWPTGDMPGSAAGHAKLPATYLTRTLPANIPPNKGARSVIIPSLSVCPSVSPPLDGQVESLSGPAHAGPGPGSLYKPVLASIPVCDIASTPPYLQAKAGQGREEAVSSVPCPAAASHRNPPPVPWWSSGSLPRSPWEFTSGIQVLTAGVPWMILSSWFASILLSGVPLPIHTLPGGPRVP